MSKQGSLRLETVSKHVSDYNDPFACRLCYQLQQYVAWKPDPNSNRCNAKVFEQNVPLCSSRPHPLSV